MSERDWKRDFPDFDYSCYSNRCTVCNELFMGHKNRILCRVCSLEGKMERMAAPVKDALNPVTRNIDLGEDQ